MIISVNIINKNFSSHNLKNKKYIKEKLKEVCFILGKLLFRFAVKQ